MQQQKSHSLYHHVSANLQPHPSPQIVSSSELVMIQNYLGTHNKFKPYFKSRKYKKIYFELLKQIPSQKYYYSMYMFDKLFALNKLIKVSLLYKQTSFAEYLKPYFQDGMAFIQQFYKAFLTDDQLNKGTMKVNLEFFAPEHNATKCSTILNQFFYVLITFLYQLALFYRSKSQRKLAQVCYEANIQIVTKILESSTSSTRLRRKICQYLISFGSFLTQNRQLIKSQKIFNLALQNSLNLIVILESNLISASSNIRNSHQTQKHIKRLNHKIQESFSFMIAIYLNLSVVYQLSFKEHLSYFALNEVRYLQQILYKRFSIKSKVAEVIKRPKEVFDFWNQKIWLLKTYFNVEEIFKIKKQAELEEKNQHLGIYGVKNDEMMRQDQKTKSIQQLFFQNKLQTKQKSASKESVSPIIKKIALINYDNENDFKSFPQKDPQQYFISTKNSTGHQSIAAYSEPLSPKSSTLKVLSNQFKRQKGRKLSKFYDQANNIIESQLTKQSKSGQVAQSISRKDFKKSQKKVTYSAVQEEGTGRQSIIQSVKNQQERSKKQNRVKKEDFLDQLIDQQWKGRQYLLYGKKFLENYDKLQNNYTVSNFRNDQLKNNQLRRSKSLQRPSEKNSCNVQYTKKNLMHIDQVNQNEKMKYNLHKSSLTKKKLLFNPSFHNNRNQKTHVVKSTKLRSEDQSAENNVQNMNNMKKEGVKYACDHKSYKEVMQQMNKLEKQSIKRDYIQKNSIYRLKCRSLNTNQNQFNLHKSTNENHRIQNQDFDQSNANKRENQREIIVFKPQSSKSSAFLGSKPTLSSSKKANHLNFQPQSGIRLLKKIIFKHKKALNIVKPDLFVNYNKNELNEQDIKLVERDSLLMVQYHMCEQETKARIKSNMQQLIVDNLRNSQENQKRVQKLNKAISEYDKNNRKKQFTNRLKQSFDYNQMGISGKIAFDPNPNFFSNTFNINSKPVSVLQSPRIQLNTNKNNGTENLLRNVLQNQFLFYNNKQQQVELKTFPLNSNSVTNPNLFLSSILYKDSTKKEFKKTRNYKNNNKIAEKDRQRPTNLYSFMDETQNLHRQQQSQIHDNIFQAQNRDIPRNNEADFFQF